MADEIDRLTNGVRESEWTAPLGMPEYEDAVRLVRLFTNASTSFIQRKLQVGYNRAASWLERMEAEGVCSPCDIAGKRQVLPTPPSAASYGVKDTPPELLKSLAQAGGDPGALVGYKGDRSMGRWIADAVLQLLPPWRPIETVEPTPGLRIIAWCVHENAKYSDNPVAEGWAAMVLAEWIDHNGGGWTWEGLCGRFTHWIPLTPDGLHATARCQKAP